MLTRLWMWVVTVRRVDGNSLNNSGNFRHVKSQTESIGVARGVEMSLGRSLSCTAGQITPVSFAKIRPSREINSLHIFLNPPICYDCSPCSASSGCG